MPSTYLMLNKTKAKDGRLLDEKNQLLNPLEMKWISNGPCHLLVERHDFV